jgi:hypothetical protein
MEASMKRLFGTCLVAATCSVGCNTDIATETDYDDVAQALTSVVVTDNGGGDIGSMVDSTTIAIGSPDISIQVEAGGKYVGTHLGLDYAYEVSCGASKTCDRTTDRADVKLKWSGDLALPYMTSKVERQGTWKLSNIQSGVVIIEGASEFTLDTDMQSIFRVANRNYHLGYSADYASVRLDRLTRRITGGSVKYEIDAERTGATEHKSDATFHISGELTFNSLGAATLTLDGHYSYAIDTTTGVVVKTSL